MPGLLPRPLLGRRSRQGLLRLGAFLLLHEGAAFAADFESSNLENAAAATVTLSEHDYNLGTEPRTQTDTAVDESLLRFPYDALSHPLTQKSPFLRPAPRFRGPRVSKSKQFAGFVGFAAVACLLSLLVGGSLKSPVRADASLIEARFDISYHPGANFLYSGVVDRQKALQASFQLSAASLTGLEQDAAKLAACLNTSEARESLKKITAFGKSARSSEEKLMKKALTSMYESPVKDVAVTSNTRALLEGLRQKVRDAEAEVASLYQQGQQLVTKIIKESMKLLEHIKKQEGNLRLLSDATQGIQKKASLLEANVLCVRDLVTVSRQAIDEAERLAGRLATRKPTSLSLLAPAEAAEHAIKMRAKLQALAAEADAWVQEGEYAARDVANNALAELMIQTARHRKHACIIALGKKAGNASNDMDEKEEEEQNKKDDADHRDMEQKFESYLQQVQVIQRSLSAATNAENTIQCVRDTQALLALAAKDELNAFPPSDIDARHAINNFFADSKYPKGPNAVPNYKTTKQKRLIQEIKDAMVSVTTAALTATHHATEGVYWQPVTEKVLAGTKDFSPSINRSVSLKSLWQTQKRAAQSSATSAAQTILKLRSTDSPLLIAAHADESVHRSAHSVLQVAAAANLGCEGKVWTRLENYIIAASRSFERAFASERRPDDEVLRARGLTEEAFFGHIRGIYEKTDVTEAAMLVVEFKKKAREIELLVSEQEQAPSPDDTSKVSTGVDAPRLRKKAVEFLKDAGDIVKFAEAHSAEMAKKAGSWRWLDGHPSALQAAAVVCTADEELQKAAEKFRAASERLKGAVTLSDFKQAGTEVVKAKAAVLARARTASCAFHWGALILEQTLTFSRTSELKLKEKPETDASKKQRHLKAVQAALDEAEESRQLLDALVNRVKADLKKLPSVEPLTAATAAGIAEEETVADMFMQRIRGLLAEAKKQSGSDDAKEQLVSQARTCACHVRQAAYNADIHVFSIQNSLEFWDALANFESMSQETSEAQREANPGAADKQANGLKDVHL